MDDDSSKIHDGLVRKHDYVRRKEKTYVQIFPPALYLRWFFFTLFSHHPVKTPTHRPTWKAQISVSHGAAAALVLVGF